MPQDKDKDIDKQHKPQQQKQQKQQQQPKKGKGGGGGSGGAAHDEGPEVPAGPKVPPRLKVMFEQTIAPKLAEKFGLKNPMQRPRISSVVVNVNMGRHLEGTKLPPNVRSTVLETISKITGQRPVVIKAKKSVSNFKVREGYETAAMVTIRRERMWHFLDRLINLATPRIKDFRGVKETAFDRQGNYAMGLSEQGVFPEINMAEVVFTHGMNISIVFEHSTPELSRFILQELGMPFRKPEAA
jgi:large subunit ribosomal protein L5